MQTFLFTDIEGSTRLWEEHGDAMAAALARHDEILNAAVGGAGGSVLKTTGDGLIAVFDSVTDGVSAAIDGQRSLDEEQWGPTGPLRVRMGVHSGDTESREGDYFGPAMNRAARIMAAGHGGQVLVSGTAASAGSLPPGVQLRDLGMHRLKDLNEPEHLYQVVHDALRSEFPAPKTLDGRPNNLPQQATEFLGREDELEAIHLMLGSPTTRLLTVTGPGGAGKTRIGLQVAAEQLDRFPDGVFFVDLSAERDPDTVFDAIARALDIPVSGGSDSLEVLESRLRDSRMLLVLDNFEQVTAAAVGLSELLQHAPGIKVLVTSRETLRVRAEKVFPVPPLSLPHPEDAPPVIAESESVRLFTDRARAVRPDFSVTEDNARRSPRSVSVSTGSPLPSSWPRPGSTCSPHRTCWGGSGSASTCSAPGAGTSPTVSGLCGGRSDGAMSCSTRANVRCSSCSRCSRRPISGRSRRWPPRCSARSTPSTRWAPWSTRA